MSVATAPTASAIASPPTPPPNTQNDTPNKTAQNLKLGIDNHSELWYDDNAVNETDSLKGDNPMRKSDTKICALYERLSREDDDVQGQSNANQSNSILTQEQRIYQHSPLYRRWHKRHDIPA